MTLNLTDLDGERSLARSTAPGRFDAGRAPIATNVTATYRNGDDRQRDQGCKREAGARGRGGARRPVSCDALGEGDDDRPYDYWVVAG